MKGFSNRGRLKAPKRLGRWRIAVEKNDCYQHSGPRLRLPMLGVVEEKRVKYERFFRACSFMSTWGFERSLSQ